LEIHFEPIIPKKPIVGLAREKIIARLGDFGLAVVNRFATYPVQKPHVRYRRTGTLGRGWTKAGPRVEGSSLVVQVGNKTVYAPNVQGFTSRSPRQVRWAGPYGWESVEVAGEEEWKKHKPSILKALEGE